MSPPRPWLRLRAAAAVTLFWALGTNAAINLDGSPAVDPLTPEDPAPIASINTYHPDEHNCPLPCTDLSNVHSWVAYHSVKRLEDCDQRMLLSLSATQLLSDPLAPVLIRSCTLSSKGVDPLPAAMAETTVLDTNPKLSDDYVERGVDTEKACFSQGTPSKQNLAFFTGKTTEKESTTLAGTLEALKEYFAAPDNCDEKLIFAYHNGTVAGVFLGADIGKPTLDSALEGLSKQNISSVAYAAAQLCTDGATSGDKVFGIAVDTTGNLAAVQKTVAGWSTGVCVDSGAQQLNHAKDIEAVEYVCCSAGDPYVKPKPVAPKPDANGICATHLIKDDDNCFNIAERYGITVNDIEKFNGGKTWAWSSCDRILATYNMCVSEGNPPLPPPAVGTECGPLVPGTKQPASGVSMASLNPCPLKACCSNWGYCGVFPQHCDITSPSGYGPGATKPGVQNTCVSNCGMEIKQNSGPPSEFGRVGYYESWNLGRDCLWLEAKNANTDGSYTHIHWAFANIDPNTWKPVINDTFKQWADFKKLPIKKILAFGGWAYSTEAATYNIIRRAILENGNEFATQIAKFLNDEGLDGVDIDWEYPGAPDIKVDGVVIGQEGDGRGYYNFLRTLKEKVGSKSVSIAAPASFYYLKAFPIDRIASVIDYIVYMTYDLHGQWDAGKKNSFDSCDSGYCIRSHVNLTETRNTLAIITKAGVPNNKIFVGEASYGRSFRMKQEGCWGPTCEFTGTPEESFANPGRCTKTAGYLSLAEINELVSTGGKQFHDGSSNTDVLLYAGDYVAYMTPTTKDTRREDWKKLNFAGSIDWAVDLQKFSKLDQSKELKPPKDGVGCILGRDHDVETVEMCQFACWYGVCPEPLCECLLEGELDPLPPVKNNDVEDIVALDNFNVDKNRLCKFACKYGYCPEDGCTKLEKEDAESTWAPGGGKDDAYFDKYDPADYHLNAYEVRGANNKKCTIYEHGMYRDRTMAKCEAICKPEVDKAKAEGRTTNYGCAGLFPLDKPLPWDYTFSSDVGEIYGRCVCDHGLVNILADLVIEAMPAIAQIGCYIAMSTLKLIVDIGVNFIPGGKILDFGLDAVATAAQIANYAYGPDEDPLGAFEWWLSPCGGSDLVPAELKKAFDILGTVADGATSFKKPEKHAKGSGKSGDLSNPKRDSDERTRGRSPGKSGSGGGANSSTNKPTNVNGHCKAANIQACMHYSSVIAEHPAWSSLVCPQEAATKSRDREHDPYVRRELIATTVWSDQHDDGWEDASLRAEKRCQRDEYPPYYLLNRQDSAWIGSGDANDPNGQLMRWLPGKQNGNAAKMWGGQCFLPIVKKLSDKDYRSKVLNARNQHTNKLGPLHEEIYAEVTVDERPVFTVTKWEHDKAPLPNDGLDDNPCWPKGRIPSDPGFVLLSYDPWNKRKWGNTPQQYAANNPYAAQYLVPP
ncbi:hypothetical protein B0T16DRAFT_370797 [Cercophora newfieldiana]|uniref:chitinase n=1 Tax=Cercophora newfieldiana TaxID=92897 RepID=A0AA40CRV8_9PEZI|nr:hypothetical protein B0T16DRAFT_370797 [Cercophora newfieldiana]